MTTDTLVSAGTELYAEVTDWLYREAELLDRYHERAWLEKMVSQDVVYQVPVRQTVERARGFGFDGHTFHLDERYGSLESRVARNETAYAWAEDPPSRVRHFVTNPRVHSTDDMDRIEVLTNVLIYRTRQDQTIPQLLGGERRDVLRREDGRLMLWRRLVLLDLTMIGTHNLSVFF